VRDCLHPISFPSFLGRPSGSFSSGQVYPPDAIGNVPDFNLHYPQLELFKGGHLPASPQTTFSYFFFFLKGSFLFPRPKLPTSTSCLHQFHAIGVTSEGPSGFFPASLSCHFFKTTLGGNERSPLRCRRRPPKNPFLFAGIYRHHPR